LPSQADAGLQIEEDKRRTFDLCSHGEADVAAVAKPLVKSSTTAEFWECYSRLPHKQRGDYQPGPDPNQFTSFQKIGMPAQLAAIGHIGLDERRYR
jgi:hypothetical protein